MTRRPILSAIVAAILLIVATAVAGVRTQQPQPVSKTPPGFNGKQALAYTTELATRFPLRNDLHPDRGRAAEWIRQQFAAMGLEPETMTFSEVIAGQKVDGLENIYAISPGKTDEIILVLAHYDIPVFVEQGAADDASGVGAVLELARVLGKEAHNRTLLFLATDSEEYGAMWGTIKFLEQFPQRDRIKAVLTLDFLNMGEQAGIQVRSMGLHRGYAPLWLRELATASIAPETRAVDVSPAIEWVERAVAIPPTEHGIFLARGIPAVDFWGVPTDSAVQKARFHTPQDRIEHLSVAAMSNYGRASERLLRTLAEMPEFPRQSGWYLGLGGGRYLAGPALALIQLWVFLPLLVFVRMEWRKRRAATVLPFARRLAGTLLPLALGYAVLKLLPEIGLMTKYEIYPATQKDPALYQPEWTAIVLVAAAIAAGVWAVRRLTAWHAAPALTWEDRRLGLLTGLAVLVLVIWAYGAGFAAVAFLSLPACLWLGMRAGARWINTLLLLLSMAVFVTFMVLFNVMYSLGILWWYLLMAASYGLFSVAAMSCFLTAAALHIEGLTLAWSKQRSTGEQAKPAEVAS